MGLMVKFIFLALQISAIVSSLVLQGSSGLEISPSAANFSAVPPVAEGSPSRLTQEEQIISDPPSPTSQQNTSPHFESAPPIPQAIRGLEPSLSPNTPVNESRHINDPALPPGDAAPTRSTSEGLQPNAPVVQPPTPLFMPPIPQQDKGPDIETPDSPSIVPVQIAPPPTKVLQPPSSMPQVQPPMLQVPPPMLQVPPPMLQVPPPLPQVPPSMPQGPPPMPQEPPPVPQVPPPMPQEPPQMPQVPPPMPQAPPLMPQVPPPMSQVPSSEPQAPPSNLPVPVASPPSKLPINSPPASPNLTVPPPSSFLGPVASPTLPVAPSNLPVPAALPPRTSPRNPPHTLPSSPVPPSNLSVPVASPPSTSRRNSSPSPSALNIPPSILPAPVASPPTMPPRNLPLPLPAFTPPSKSPVPVSSAPSKSPRNLQPIHHNSSTPPSRLPEPHLSPMPSVNRERDGVPVSSPANRTTSIAPTHHSPVKAPSVHKAPSSYNHAPPPDSSYVSPPPRKAHHPPSLSPLYPPPPPGPTSKQRRHPSPPPNPAVPPFHTSVSPAISPSEDVQSTMPSIAPKISPSRASPRIPKMPIQALPPPPPNEDCSSLTCKDPLTNTPPGAPCNCVLPMQIELGLGVALYTFFPLVSELASEIASGVFMKSSQVRIMGANADTEDPEKTIVIIDLVPLGEKFDNFTAYLTAQKFWMKQLAIKYSLFGAYEVLYVKYPGLPPSPPLPSSGTGSDPYGHGSDGRTIKPLGVDVSKQRPGNKLSGSIIAMIVLSSVVAAVLCCVVAWVLLFKHRDRSESEPTPPATLPSLTKSSGIAASTVGSGRISASLSFGSSIAYTGSAKTFSSSDMEKATNNFNEAGVLGEGGFGRVYSGVLEDGTKVAVKVLKRDDQQGSREFLAEVEMLSRLHHRNLVRLIGICIEERHRCLVYELIPNGSVESHLHGIDKEIAPLDWGARLKIALGAARGLAYLHEDSSPRVIHRDFKSSNILLEHDFTPKVSDFGLARTALDEENRHISTRVMGTFGYVAPEYAMTGHLLVKSDVYSYGVVLLELLTGRKPVDMSMPLGQENLVAWARPLLSTREGLEVLIDPSLGPDFPLDSIAKVAAIASMCVQPEVSHRPFMGEVVQALKLVCNECEETRDLGSRSCSVEDLTSVDFDPRVSTNSGPAQSTYSNYESPLDVESGLSASCLGLDSGSYMAGSSSGPLRTGRRLLLWERMKRFSGGGVSDHGDFSRLLSRSR